MRLRIRHSVRLLSVFLPGRGAVYRLLRKHLQDNLSNSHRNSAPQQSGLCAATDTDGQSSHSADSTCRSCDNRTVNDTDSGVSHPHRSRLLSVGILLSAGLLWSTPLAAAAPAVSGPASCVPFGTAQLPPGAPSGGGRVGLAHLPTFTGSTAPTSVEIRTPITQFNRFWDFALVDHDLLARPREPGVPTTEA